MCTPNTHMHNKYISLNTVSFFCLCDHCLCIHIATLDIPPWSTAGKKLDVFDFSLWLRVSEERGGGGETERATTKIFNVTKVCLRRARVHDCADCLLQCWQNSIDT